MIVDRPRVNTTSSGNCRTDGSPVEEVDAVLGAIADERVEVALVALSEVAVLSPARRVSGSIVSVDVVCCDGIVTKGRCDMVWLAVFVFQE